MILLENLPLASLVEAPINPNFMTEEHFDTLVRAIRVEGFLQPVLVRQLEEGRYEIVDGHHRARAAAKAGMAAIPAVIAEPGMDAATARARAIGMNQRRGELDLTTVGKMFHELREVHGWTMEALALTGFSESEVGDLLRSVAQDVDSALPKDISIPGDAFDDEEESAPAAKPFVLEIPFANRDDFRRARKGLRRAAGKGKDMAVGLLSLLGDEEKEADKS